MAVFKKIRSFRNSVVVKDEMPLGDCEVLNVRVDGVAFLPNRVALAIPVQLHLFAGSLTPIRTWASVAQSMSQQRDKTVSDCPVWPLL